MATYTYDPSKLSEKGKDKVRFDLGDTLVEMGAMKAYLSDEEIEACLAEAKTFKRAELMLVESLVSRFAYEVDTKVGTLSYSLKQRYDAWLAKRNRLKAEVEGESALPSDSVANGRRSKPSFWKGMHDHPWGLSRGDWRR